MPAILTRFAGLRQRSPLGMGPSMVGLLPLPAPAALVIAGVTKDSTGAALAGCVVQLFRTLDDSFVAEATSDGSGNYSFTVGPGQLYYAVAYKPGAPDVSGTTLNTLAGA